MRHIKSWTNQPHRSSAAIGSSKNQAYLARIYGLALHLVLGFLVTDGNSYFGRCRSKIELYDYLPGNPGIIDE